MHMSIHLKRAYDKPARNDGQRILVDRLWPRGVSKNEAGIDLWLKDISPSSALRKWFNHDPEKWLEFKTRYFQELATQADVLEMLAAKAQAGWVTLVFAAKNEEFNNAVAIKEYLEKHLPRQKAGHQII
jgi:uncharacterized protein YeaO (DUF488 family)